MVIGTLRSRTGALPVTEESPSTVFVERAGFRAGGLSLPLPPHRRGGDHVGVVAVGRGFMAYVVDAEGKGEPASSGGRLMESAIRRSIEARTYHPGDVLSKLNVTLLNAGLRGAAAVVWSNGERVVAGSAGNPSPVLFEHGSASAMNTSGTLLGFTSTPEFDTCSVSPAPGTFFALFSDGLTDCEARNGELFSPADLAPFLDPDRSMSANLLACLDKVTAHAPQSDDLSLVLCQCKSVGTLPQFEVRNHGPLICPQVVLPHHAEYCVYA